MAKHRPDWAPEDDHPAFAVKVVDGVQKTELMSQSPAKRKELTVEEMVAGVKAGDRMVLARTITLIESNAATHFEKAQAVLEPLLPYSGNSIRIGISGVPGAGKSTFIEALGLYLIDNGHKVAVLAVDPSSSLTRGSILGDKTRMEKLGRLDEAFIRPSPSGGNLGGVARKSRETILACEAAGFDVILVETVGVGQSEITVRSMVDFFLLLQIAGAGDELQGIKKGIIEISDALIVNKADGDNLDRARRARAEYDRVLHYLTPVTPGWALHAYTCSALMGDGIKEIWSVINDFRNKTTNSGFFKNRREHQQKEWMIQMIEDELKRDFYDFPPVKKKLEKLKTGQLKSLPTQMARELLSLYRKSR